MHDHLDKAKAYFYENTSTMIQKNDPKLYNLSAGFVHLTEAIREVEEKLDALKKS